jgi:hemolysin D
MPLRLLKFEPRTKDRRRNLSSLEREFLPHLLEIEETPPSPVQRKVLWAIIILVVVLIAWACLGQISVVATVPGKFIPDGRVKQIQPLESSVIKAIHVKEGQQVKEGDLLLELDPTINEAEFKANADKYEFNRLERERLAAELAHGKSRYGSAQTPEWIALQESIRHAHEASHADKLAQARAAVEEKTHALAAAEATRKKYEETTALAEQREASARPLVETGAISKLDYWQLKQELANNANDLAAQLKTIDQARAAKKEAEHKLAQVKHDRVADIYNDLGQKVANQAGLKGDLDKAKQLFDLKWLKAPVAGVVQKVDVATIGGVVTPAQSLVTIVPAGTPLIVEATLTNDDIGYVRQGQNVEIKVDTFPFQKYGTLKGTLVWISPDAEEKTSDATGTGSNGDNNSKTSNGSKSAKAGYLYKVHIQPEQRQFIVDGKPVPIQSGMTVQADIITDHRRVIEFFLSPVVKYLDEGLKVR